MVKTKRSPRKPENLNVPDYHEDSAERKRVLNILAQRRYRQRKREELQNLKKQKNCDVNSATEQSVTQTKTARSSICHQQDTLAIEPFHNQANISESQQVFFDCEIPFQSDAESTSQEVLQPNITGSDAGSWPLYSSNSSESGLCPTTPLSTSSSSFPDEIFLPMLELNLLRACMSIAKRLRVDHLIWELNSLSPFTSSSDLTHNHLPVNLQPTLVQLTVPHHPVFDMMPWPGVRDKLILVFSQPLELRPPTAASPTAFTDLVYDMEDSAEGIRIWGDDPYAAENWELGQKVFQRWWWAFESHIVKNSNTLREQRGATTLGYVLGEVT